MIFKSVTVKLSKAVVLLGVIVGAMFCFTAQAQNTIKAVQQQNNHCRHMTLPFDALTEGLKLAPEQWAVLSSPYYCIGYAANLSYGDIDTTLLPNQARSIISRYHQVWPALSSDAQKIAFAHVFLKQLSQTTAILAKTAADNQLNVVIAARENNRLLYLTHNLSVNDRDYWVVTQGLEAIALSAAESAQESAVIAGFDGIKALVKWVIKGTGKPKAIFEHETGMNTLLPTGNNNYCVECMTYFIDQIIESGGGGYSGPYNWMGYSSVYMLYSVAEGIAAEQLQCSVHNDCYVYDYEVVTDDGYGEKCVEVLYNDGHTISGLYCEVYNRP